MSLPWVPRKGCVQLPLVRRGIFLQRAQRGGRSSIATFAPQKRRVPLVKCCCKFGSLQFSYADCAFVYLRLDRISRKYCCTARAEVRIQRVWYSCRGTAMHNSSSIAGGCAYLIKAKKVLCARCVLVPCCSLYCLRISIRGSHGRFWKLDHHSKPCVDLILVESRSGKHLNCTVALKVL